MQIGHPVSGNQQFRTLHSFAFDTTVTTSQKPLSFIKNWEHTLPDLAFTLPNRVLKYIGTKTIVSELIPHIPVPQIKYKFGSSDYYMGGGPEITLGCVQTDTPLWGKCPGIQNFPSWIYRHIPRRLDNSWYDIPAVIQGINKNDRIHGINYICKGITLPPSASHWSHFSTIHQPI